jgi:hypothetical protein
MGEKCPVFVCGMSEAAVEFAADRCGAQLWQKCVGWEDRTLAHAKVARILAVVSVVLAGLLSSFSLLRGNVC